MSCITYLEDNYEQSNGTNKYENNVLHGGCKTKQHQNFLNLKSSNYSQL